MEKKKKILIIDDEEDICDMAGSALRKTGLYEVLATVDPAEGCKICEREHPDLVVLDYVMPNMRGDEVIAHLHHIPTTQNIPIILVSGLGEIVYYHDSQEWKWNPDSEIVRQRGDIPEIFESVMEPEELARKFGVSLFLSKPFTRTTFLQMVEKVLEQQAG